MKTSSLLFKVLGLSVFLTLLTHSEAATNPEMMRKFRCATNILGQSYMADIYHDGMGAFGHSSTGKGFFTMLELGSGATPSLVSNVAMNWNLNASGKPCIFVSKFSLNPETPFNVRISINECEVSNGRVYGTTMVSWVEPNGTVKRMNSAVECKVDSNF